MRRRLLRDEKGTAVLEFALVFPLVFFVLLASLSLLWTLSVRSTLSGAARDGARFASIRQGPMEDYPTEAEVEAYVRDRVGDFDVDEVVVVRPSQPNATLSVTVRRELPFFMDDLVFESEAKARAE